MRFFLALLLFVPAFSLAQNLTPFSIEISPENPGPNESVLVVLSSFSFDLNRATISWSVNGRRIESGTGKKSFSFKVGEIGSSTNLGVSVSLNGESYTETRIFRPGEVDVLWEAIDSYTPPFYKGKALPAPRSLIRATAIPNLRSGQSVLNPSSLIYAWKLNEKASEFFDQSGYGKQSVIFRGGLLSLQEFIEVSVSNQNGSVGGAGTALSERVKPLILFYEKDPLRGTLYSEALPERYTPKNREVIISAEPYFFSDYGIKAGFSFEWLFNNEPISSELKENEAGFRAGGQTGGEGTVFLEIRNENEMLQFGRNSLRLIFPNLTE